jgi:hypothetical protein
MDLLSLPYDIRYKIYEHVFPPGKQIYIQAFGANNLQSWPQTLRSITPDHGIPTNILSTCRALQAEGSEYLYNNYLFNIIGTKHHCLDAYNDFLSTVKKYARNEVHVNAFSNGSHSSTMCLSIHCGEGRTAMLRRRERGEPKAIDELEKEVAANRSLQESTARSGAYRSLYLRQICGAIIGLLVLLFSWWMR